MSLNQTPSGERVHIGIFGKRNAGKSSIINAITGQELAIVSEVKGTTTDPVSKSMELLPLGPVVIIDTAGLDDNVNDSLGAMRIEKSYQVLNKVDIALLIVDANIGITTEDNSILERIKKKNIPHILVYNKIDTCKKTFNIQKNHEIYVSSSTKENIEELKNLIGSVLNDNKAEEKPLVRDLVQENDFVILVVPIDKAAPKGRLILPQQQVIRDLLEAGAISLVVRDTELATCLKKLGTKPSLVITDSQAFKEVANIVPEDILLTSFSILFARYKGELENLVQAAKILDTLEDNDTILISEACTHHRQCGDIGTDKLPKLIKKFTGKEINFEFSSGTEFPTSKETLCKYKMVAHCGACMIKEREMKYRIACAKDLNIPMTNYGTAIAYMNGILERSLHVFNKD